MPEKRMSGLLLVAVLATLVGLPLFAGGQEEAQEALTIQIAFPIAVDAPVTDILNGYAEAYMAENPTVTVEPIYSGGYGDVKTMVQTTIDGGGDAPSLAIMLATDLFDLANAQYIEPMTAYAADLEDGDAYLDDFLPAFMANSWYMNDLWSLPFQRSAVVMYYNADMIDAAGLSAPDSWDSLAAVAAALTEKNGDTVVRWGMEYPSGWPYWLFQPLALGAGQNIVEESDTEVVFNHPDVIKAVKFYNSLSSEYAGMPPGVQGSWGNVVPNFVSGNTGMIIHSSGSLSNVLSQADFEVGVMGVPGEVAGTEYSVPGGGNIYMIAGMSEAEKKAAFDFAVFITDPARAAGFSIATGYIATRKSAMDDEDLKAYMTKNPQVGDVQSVLTNAGKEFSVQNLGEIRNIFHKYLQAAYNGEMTPEEAMETAQTEADEALADFR